MSEDTLKQSYTRMANRLYRAHPSSELLKTAAEAEKANEIVEVMNGWLSARGNNRWVLVYDNIDNPKLPGVEDAQAYDIKSYFPDAHQGFILITTRASQLKIGKVISVKKFENVGESIAILSHMSKRQISDQGM